MWIMFNYPETDKYLLNYPHYSLLRAELRLKLINLIYLFDDNSNCSFVFCGDKKN